MLNSHKKADQDDSLTVPEKEIDEELEKQLDIEEELESQYGDGDEDFCRPQKKIVDPGFSRQKKIMEKNKGYVGNKKPKVNLLPPLVDQEWIDKYANPNSNFIDLNINKKVKDRTETITVQIE